MGGKAPQTAAYLESVKAAHAAAGGAADATGMATGGIVRKPMLAQLAERGPEAVVPLGKGGGVGATHVNFTPNITIHGGATPENQELLHQQATRHGA